MKVAVVRTTIDKTTGRQINQKTIGYEEIDEDAYYRPLVEMLGDRILTSCKEEREKRVG